MNSQEGGVGKAAWDMAQRNPQLAGQAMAMAGQVHGMMTEVPPQQQPTGYLAPGQQQHQQQQQQQVMQGPGPNDPPAAVVPPRPNEVKQYTTGGGPTHYTIDGIQEWLARTDFYPHNPSGRPRQPARWLPNSESDNFCPLTGLEFDWVRRKHHCRLCGGIFAEEVASRRTMLPEDIIIPKIAPKLPGEDPKAPPRIVAHNSRDPQRVCDPCYEACQPFQDDLCNQECNAIQAAEVLDESTPMRFMNSPISFSLESEIKKAAYTVSNITYQGGIIKDKSIPLPLLHKAKGIAFLTVLKAGAVFTGSIGTGLVTAKQRDGNTFRHHNVFVVTFFFATLYNRIVVGPFGDRNDGNGVGGTDRRRGHRFRDPAQQQLRC
jgi:hypothetical protein